MVSRYRRLAESIRQKFRFSSTPAFRPSASTRNERMLVELNDFARQLRKMQTLVDTHRQTALKTCARSRSFITAKVPKLYTNGPMGASVVTVSQDLSYDTNAVEVMSTLEEKLEEQMHVNINLPIENWLDALKEVQKDMAGLERARLEADTRKREVARLEGKLSNIHQRPALQPKQAKPKLRPGGFQQDDDSEPSSSPWNQQAAEQVQEKLQRKRERLDSAQQFYEEQEEQLYGRLVQLSQRCSKELQEYQYQLYRLVSDFYRQASDLILPTPAGSSVEFLRRATEKIQASGPTTTLRSSLAPSEEGGSPTYPSYPNRGQQSQGSTGYPTPKQAGARPDILVLENNAQKQAAPKVFATPTSSSYRGSPAPGPFGSARPAVMNRSTTLPPALAASKAVERPGSSIGRSKTVPPPLNIPAAAKAAPPQPQPESPAASVAESYQSSAHPAAMQQQPLGNSLERPMLQSTRSSATGTPRSSASPATRNAFAPAAASASASAPTGPPSDADLMLMQQRVAALYAQAQAKHAAGDMQSASVLQAHAMQQAAALRQALTQRQAAAAAASAPAAIAGARDSNGGSEGLPSPSPGEQRGGALGQPQAQLTAGPQAQAGGMPAQMLTVHRQRIQVYMEAAAAKQREGDTEGAMRLQHAAAQQAAMLRSMEQQHMQQQQQRLAAEDSGSDAADVQNVQDAGAPNGLMGRPQPLQVAPAQAAGGAMAAKRSPFGVAPPGAQDELDIGDDEEDEEDVSEDGSQYGWHHQGPMGAAPHRGAAAQAAGGSEDDWGPESPAGLAWG